MTLNGFETQERPDRLTCLKDALCKLRTTIQAWQVVACPEGRLGVQRT